MSDHFALLANIEEQYETYLELSGIATAPGVAVEEAPQHYAIAPLGLTLA